MSDRDRSLRRIGFDAVVSLIKYSFTARSVRAFTFITHMLQAREL